jgi:hypothetical protein
MGAKGNAYRILVGNPDGKRPVGRPRRRWVVNIKMELNRMGWYGLDQSGSGRDQRRALVNSVMNLRVP